MLKVEDNDDNEEEVCVHCGGTPCEWDEFAPELLERDKQMHGKQGIDGVVVVVDDDGIRPPNKMLRERVENRERRKSMYRMFTYLKYGHLGRGVRIPIPECVLTKIKEIYPDPDGEYMGFKESEASEVQETTTSTATLPSKSSSRTTSPGKKRMSSRLLDLSTGKKQKRRK